MKEIKTLGEWLEQRGLTQENLEELTGLEAKVVLAIMQGRYTPSPQQRSRLAAALGLDPHQIVWGHRHEVYHLYGHGPQFGRSP